MKGVSRADLHETPPQEKGGGEDALHSRARPRYTSANAKRERNMLSEERNRTLTQVGPGTPMGELLRRYWMPIAGASELETPRPSLSSGRTSPRPTKSLLRGSARLWGSRPAMGLTAS